MADIKVTRKTGLPYHSKECGMLHTGNPYCIPCRDREAELREAFWKAMDETSARGGTVDAHG